jgi:Ca-activated chloride channel homolog
MVSRKYLVILILFLCGSLPLFAQVPEDEEVLRVDTALVNVPFSVSDREGRSILGLKAENFTLFEDGKPIKTEYLSTQDNPLNIVLLLDTSRSAVERLDKIKNAATEFIKQLRPNDKCMVVSFDSAARVKSEFTGDQYLLNKAIKRTVLGEKQGTVMRDAISVIIEKELPRVKGRKAIILITDGKDAGSSVGENDLLHKLAESDAPIYSVLYETVLSVEPLDNKKYDKKKLKQYQIAQQKKNEEAANFMEKLADVTGGRSYRKEINNLSEAFVTITEELRKQYLIGFYPEDANYNISKHQIKIKIDIKNAVVRLKNYTLLK